jgi:putative DNA primase/helicase
MSDHDNILDSAIDPAAPPFPPNNKRRKGESCSEKEENNTTLNLPYTSCTSNTSKAYSDDKATLENAQPYTPYTESALLRGIEVIEGCLIEDSEKGPRRLIASKAAQIVAASFRGKFAFCPDAEVWHRFDETHFRAIPNASALHETLTTYLYSACGDLGFIPTYQTQIVQLLQTGRLLPMPAPPLNCIPFKNGLLRMDTMDLEPITPRNATTYALPHTYDSDADCPTIKRWLHDIVDNDAETVQLLRAWLAALLLGMASLQKFLHLIGPGGTGKSTFLRLMEVLIGSQNVVSTDLRQLEQNRFESATLYNKRLALVADSDRYGGSVNVLKSITGQDAVRLETKHKQQHGHFVFEGLVTIASNEPLASTDYTSGLERRSVTVEMLKRVSAEQRAEWNRQGGEKAVLHAELPGLVNWVLALSREEITRIFEHPPQRTANANLEALTASNPLVDWLRTSLAPAPGHWSQIGRKEVLRVSDTIADDEDSVELTDTAPSKRKQIHRTVYANADEHLYPNYLRWCDGHGRESLSERRFRSVLTDMAKTLGADVIANRRAAGQGLQGIRLLQEDEELYSWGQHRHEVTL